MGALTVNRHKCLIKVNRKPIIDFVIQSFVGAECNRIFFFLGYRKEEMQKHIIQNSGGAFKSHFISPSQKVGQAFLEVGRSIGSAFLYSHGNIKYHPSILEELILAHEKYGASATVAFSPRDLAYGHLHAFAENGEVKDAGFFPRHCKDNDMYKFCSMGISVLTPEILRFLPKKGNDLPILIEQLYLNAIRAGYVVKAVVHSGEWLHLMSPKDLRMSKSRDNRTCRRE